ncbi:MAG: tetratricopeptide repeat protein [Verrucomicrobiota bacterium]|jgi:Flp pilus assembly protein TadD
MFPIQLRRTIKIALALALPANCVFGQGEDTTQTPKANAQSSWDSAVPLLLGPSRTAPALQEEPSPLGGLRPRTTEMPQSFATPAIGDQEPGTLFRRNPMEATATLFAEQANAHAAEERFDLALQRIQQAIRLAPEDFRFYITLGNILVRSGRMDQARRAYEAALTVAPNSQIAACNLGTVLVAQGDLFRALYLLQSAHTRQPDHALTNINLGAVLAMLGKDEQALSHWGEARERAPDLLVESFQDPMLRAALARPALKAFVDSIVLRAMPSEGEE